MAIPLLGIYLRRSIAYVHQEPHTKMFIVPLFVLANYWKQEKDDKLILLLNKKLPSSKN